MIMNDLEFGHPGKTFKKVKSIQLRLSNKSGEYVQTDITVYLKSAGTPSFLLLLPPEYNSVFHTHHEGDFRNKPDVDKMGLLSSDSYDKVIKDLEKVSLFYSDHMKALSIKKVIILWVSIKSQGSNFNAPSFDNTRFLIGVRSEVAYEINEKIYSSRGAINTDEGYIPEYKELYATDRGGNLRIPFTNVSWMAIKNIEQTIQAAAQMLMQLTNAEEAIKLLASPTFALLGHKNDPEC